MTVLYIILAITVWLFLGCLGSHLGCKWLGQSGIINKPRDLSVVSCGLLNLIIVLIVFSIDI